MLGFKDTYKYLRYIHSYMDCLRIHISTYDTFIRIWIVIKYHPLQIRAWSSSYIRYVLIHSNVFAHVKKHGHGARAADLALGDVLDS